jgi:hypothetical protein
MGKCRLKMKLRQSNQRNQEKCDSDLLALLVGEHGSENDGSAVDPTSDNSVAQVVYAPCRAVPSSTARNALSFLRSAMFSTTELLFGTGAAVEVVRRKAFFRAILLPGCTVSISSTSMFRTPPRDTWYLVPMY